MSPRCRKLWEFVAGLLVLAGALIVSGRAVAASDPKRELFDPKPEFARFDADHDGYVSLEEFSAQGGDIRAFRDADANRDGRLGQDEFIKARSIDQRIKTGRYFDDAWITARIKAQLMRDYLLDSLNIRVETERGVVQLSGEVKTTEQASHAIGLASAVGGVVSVHNGLVIK